jgi:hypothetical protein
MRYQRNVTLLLGRIELVKLDAGAKLDATECAEIIGAELVGGTNHGSGRGRQLERGRYGRRESG